MFSDKWIIKDRDDRIEKTLVSALGLCPLTARLLASRGYVEPSAALDFIEKRGLEFHDPYLLNDMDKAVERIRLAAENGESVCIYGDYDVDGVTATTMLYTYLTEMGIKCTYYIPDRLTEGYGLSIRAIEKIASENSLIITVDTGITALEETEYARTLGTDVIITDHHSCRETLPAAVAVINPHRTDCSYPFSQLAGVGVVFKLICALSGDTGLICRRFADLAAIGTIADVMPLVDENRLIAVLGLECLKNTSNIGLRALMRHSGLIKPDGTYKRISASSVGYVLAPRINAAGRIASATTAVELLLCRDPERADAIASRLCEINKIRQQTEQDIYSCAEEKIRRQGKDSPAFVLASDGWHQGVIGVVASKITEKYSLPSILLSLDGVPAKGSGRSIRGLSLMEALAHCADLVEEYGGHELAAGLSVRRENIDAFRERFCAYVAEKLKTIERTRPIEVDCRASLPELNLKAAEQLRLLEPFGLQNPVPLFLLEDAVAADIVPLSDGKHIRLRLTDGRLEAGAVFFGMTIGEFPVFPGEKCDVIFTLDINEFNGRSSPQLLLRAARPCAAVREGIEAELKLYSLAAEGALGSRAKEVTPVLDDFRAVFRFLRHELGGDKKRLSLRYMQRQLENVEKRRLGLCRIMIILDVLEECGLADRSYVKGYDLAELMLLPFSGKINLDDSHILKKLRDNG